MGGGFPASSRRNLAARGESGGMEGTPPPYQPPPGAPPPGAPPPGAPPPGAPPPGAPPVAADEYPVRFDVDYPDRQLDRLSSGLRIFWVIPILIVLSTVVGSET